jgi:hypothetical protein
MVLWKHPLGICCGRNSALQKSREAHVQKTC